MSINKFKFYENLRKSNKLNPALVALTDFTNAYKIIRTTLIANRYHLDMYPISFITAKQKYLLIMPNKYHTFYTELLEIIKTSNRGIKNKIKDPFQEASNRLELWRNTEEAWENFIYNLKTKKIKYKILNYKNFFINQDILYIKKIFNFCELPMDKLKDIIYELKQYHTLNIKLLNNSGYIITTSNKEIKIVDKLSI